MATRYESGRRVDENPPVRYPNKMIRPEQVTIKAEKPKEPPKADHANRRHSGK